MMTHLLLLIGVALVAAAPPPEPGAVTPPGEPSAATAPRPKLRFQYRCPGAAWADWTTRSRDCTGAYPMLLEGSFASTTCPALAGVLPDVPWRRAQAGTAEWRLVDATDVVRSTITGPCVDDPAVYALLPNESNPCRIAPADLHRAGCRAEENHTVPAVFAMIQRMPYPDHFVLLAILEAPAYATP